MRLVAFALSCLGVLVTPTSALASQADISQQKNIPALLQFAEQYQSNSDMNGHKTMNGKLSRERIGAAHIPKQTVLSGTKTSPIRPGNPSIKDNELKEQREKIASLEQEVSFLRQKLQKKDKPRAVKPIDLKGLSQFATQVRRALSFTPEEKIVAESIRLANAQTASALKEELNLKNQLENMQSNNAALQQSMAELKSQSQQKIAKITASWKQQDETYQNSITGLQRELAAAKVNQSIPLTADSLKTADAKQNYAAGISLGEEILQMQAERNRWGVKIDKQLMLAGIVDTFSGKRRLSDEVLNQALTDAENEVVKARGMTLSAQVKAGNSYLEKFKQQKGVQQAKTGFWYKIDYAGDAPVASSTIVDVVVKESLTDGTVVQDMESSGAVLSQKVADFPPLFQEALASLKNHGSMTLVVPPALAYGDKGYPPKVPPDATMVYQLRIAEMYPDGKMQ